ncbi:MAG: DUF3971 domain-containing protein [Methylovulum sp.]|nr:DUF3971 domain-containing protein [Methylovulum sp.]
MLVLFVGWATRHLIFWSLITIAVSLTGVRLILSGMDAFKMQLAGHISETIGAPVAIGRLRAKMRRFSPELILTDITIASSIANAPPAVALKEIRLGINLLDMFVNRAVLPSMRVTLVGAKLSVHRKDDGSFAIIGLKAGDGQPLWLFEGSKFEVLQSEITWQDEKRKKTPLKLGSVDLAVINVAGRHKINMLAKLPKLYGGGSGNTLTVAMDFSGDPFTASAIDGVVFLDGKNLTPALFRMVDLPLTLQSGSSDLRVWGRLQHSQLVSVNGEIQLLDMKFLRPNKGEFAVKSLGTQFHWWMDGNLSNANLWRLDVSHFLLQTVDDDKHINKWPDAIFSLSAQRNDESALQQITLHIEQIDLQEMSRMALFFAPIPDETAALLAQAQVKGRLDQLSLIADWPNKTATIDGNFTGLSYAPFLSVPGIQNLTGKIIGTDKQGMVNFSTQGATIASPGLFREALVIKSLGGVMNWQQRSDGWQLSSPAMKLDLLGLQSESRLRVNLPKNQGLPFIDLQTTLACDDASQLKHYFPTGVIKPADIEWLDRAFVRGRVENGRLSYYGKLEKLASLKEEATPKKSKSYTPLPRPDILPGAEGAYRVQASEMIDGALFEALLDVRQLELDYAPDWPHISDIAGELQFLQGRMEVNAYQGYSTNLKANKAIVINEAVGESKQLLVQGEVEGEIADTLAFLQQTPLNSRVGALIGSIVPEGRTQVALDLSIPLAKGVEPKVDGSATLNHAGLTVKAVDLVVNKIDGLLKFNGQGIYSDTIHASALKHPIRINVDNADNQTRVNVSGLAEVSAIEKQFGLPDWGVAEGTMNYQLKLVLPYQHFGNPAPERTTKLAVDSDMTGVALSLPGALTKTKAEVKPLSIVFNLGDKSLLPIAITYDHKLKAAIQFDTVKQRIGSGHILLGKGEALQSNDTGLKLEINQDTLNLKDWLVLPAGKNNQAGIDIRDIKIHSDNAQWGNTALGVFDLALKPEGSYWAGHINSPFAMGKIHIPVNKGRIALDMEMLDLSALKQLKPQSDGQPLHTEEDTVVLPETLPLFDISSDKTLWQSVDLGLLTLQTERIAHGIALKKLELTGLAQQLDMSGTWTSHENHTQTALQGHLNMPNAGALLKQLNVTSDLVETSGKADFSVHWPAAPQHFTLAALQGDIDIHFTDGRILSIEPGFGRMLGILAMAQWIKRLQLDFRDIYEEGLTFNSIKGHFMLLDGKASTQNLVVDAIPATITIMGDTDLVNKTVDQRVNVAPKGADAVPIAGTIMDKVTTLIARTVTGEDQGDFFLGSQYRIKGQWDTMQVIPLHDRDGLLQKTWTGITGFPWLQQPQD